MRILKRLGASLAALLLAGPAVAATLQVELSWMNASGGTSTWRPAPLEGTPTGNGQEEQFVGQHVGSSWTLSWDAIADEDPFVNGNFTILNSSAITQTYTFTVTLPITPPVAPVSSIGGSIGVTVTDANGDGVGSVGLAAGSSYIYTALNDGTTTLQLLGAGLVPLSVPFAGGSATVSRALGLPGATIASIAANGTISITHTFTLTAGDSIGLTSFYQVNPVPEPGTLALFSAGALGLAALGRRRRI